MSILETTNRNVRLLQISDLKAWYSKRQVLHDVSFEVGEAEIVGLIGPNGAGKSTVLKGAFGVLQRNGGRIEGKVVFNGRDIASAKPHENVRRGMGLLLQGGTVFHNLSVEDNLMMGAIHLNGWRRKKEKDLVFALFPNLARFSKRRAGLLSGGEQHMLALGVLLMSKPKLLLLDEPSAGLAYNLVDDTMEAIKKIKEELRCGILLVEQNVEKCLKVSDRVYLMLDGRIVDQVTHDVADSEKKVSELFLI